MRTTAKAVVKLLGGTDGKAGGFLVMEWAQTHVIRATFFELNVATYHVDNVNAGDQIGDKRLGNHCSELAYLLGQCGFD